MKKEIIRLENVWKVYKMGGVSVNATKNISMTVYKGQFLAITGNSGSGKSTVMHLIGCLDIPSKGKLFLDTNDVSKLTESELAQIRGRKIGFVFQQFNLIPTLTALENVALPGEFQNMEKTFLYKKAKELLNYVGLGDRLNHRPTQLSGGQMQRVAIARALINDPDVILADEPTGALDTKAEEQVMGLLKELNRKNKKSIVIVTHNPSLLKYVDYVVELKDGEILRKYEKN